MNHPTFHNRHTPSTSPAPPPTPGTRPPQRTPQRAPRAEPSPPPAHPTQPTTPSAPGTRPPGAPRTTHHALRGRHPRAPHSRPLRRAPAPPGAPRTTHHALRGRASPRSPRSPPPKPRVVAPHTRVSAQPAARPMSGARLSAAACIPEPPPIVAPSSCIPAQPTVRLAPETHPPPVHPMSLATRIPCCTPTPSSGTHPPYAHRPCMARPPRHPLLSP